MSGDKLARAVQLPLQVDPGWLAKEERLKRAAKEAARFVAECDSKNTRRAFERSWARWSEWCRDHGLLHEPVDPRHLITYLTDLSLDEKAPSTVRAALTAISVIDQRARASWGEVDPLPVRSDPLVRQWARGWRREHPAAPKKAPAITPRQLEQIVEAAQERAPNTSVSHHVHAYARDRCMVVFALIGALRVSELVALDLADVRETPRGVEITIRRGKTDQAGKGKVRLLMPQGRPLRDPVEAYGLWLRVRGDQPGPLFVGVGRDGALSETRLDESTARRVVIRRAKAAAIDLPVTSHSMRSTFATIAHRRGKSLSQIADHGGWGSLQTVHDYIRQGNLWIDNPTSGLLDDDE